MKVLRMVDVTIRVGEDSRLRKLEEEVEIDISATEA